MPSNVRLLIGYAYGTIFLKTEVPDGVDKFHWHATVALLHCSHRLDLVAVHNNAIDALKMLFPCGPDFTYPDVPGIVGVKSDDRTLFLRIIPLEAIDLFRQYKLHAAQLAITDIARGVVCNDGCKVTISTAAGDVIVVLEGREQLKLSRRIVLLRCSNDLTPGLDYLLKILFDIGNPAADIEAHI